MLNAINFVLKSRTEFRYLQKNFETQLFEISNDIFLIVRTIVIEQNKTHDLDFSPIILILAGENIGLTKPVNAFKLVDLPLTDQGECASH